MSRLPSHAFVHRISGLRPGDHAQSHCISSHQKVESSLVGLRVFFFKYEVLCPSFNQKEIKKKKKKKKKG